MKLMLCILIKIIEFVKGQVMFWVVQKSNEYLKITICVC